MAINKQFIGKKNEMKNLLFVFLITSISARLVHLQAGLADPQAKTCQNVWLPLRPEKKKTRAYNWGLLVRLSQLQKNAL